MRRLSRITLGLGLLGVAVAGLWIYLAGGSAYVRGLARINPWFILPLLLLTALCVLVRFVRWHFLLRRVGIRVPTRASLAIFLASLAGTATPAYAGELIRGVFMRRRFGTPLRLATWVLIVERLLDVAALGLIGALTAERAWMGGVLALFVPAAWLAGFVGGNVARRMGVDGTAIAQLRDPVTVVQAFCLALVAWVPAGLLVRLAAASLDIPLTAVAGMHVFSSATLLGGMSLMPAGVGATGSLAIVQLTGRSVPFSDAVVAVSLVRATSVGVALAVATIFLVIELQALRRPLPAGRDTHFEDIGGHYREQFPTPVWNYLLDRKVAMLDGSLPKPASRAGIGLDLGCGAGYHCVALGARHYRVVGMDAAQNLVRQARTAGATVAAGDALALPFRDAGFDYVYAVGVLHHLTGAEAQAGVCREVRRVLKPGGLFIVHETSPRNPLFRFYMGYIFPIVRSIDVGTERWIEPERWEAVDGLRLIDLQYSTFVPDFLPQWLMRPLLVVERALEASALRRYAVHYMATLRKELLPATDSRDWVP